MNQAVSTPDTNAAHGLNDFVTALYRLHRDLETPHTERSARAQLARLRRSFNNGFHYAEAMGWVIDQEPPADEIDTAMLVAGLFALRPQPYARTTFAGALGDAGAGGDAAVRRRFSQLLAAKGDGLAHYLRQAVTLLDSRGRNFNFYRLAQDLMVLRWPALTQEMHVWQNDIRIGWAKDYYKHERRAEKRDDDSHPTPE